MPQHTADLPPPALHAPAPPAPAPAAPARGALLFSLGVAGGASGWRGDGLGFGGLTVGLQLWRVVTPYVGAALGYAVVDQRLLTRLTVGVDVGYTLAGRYRPRLFAAFVHQHEESLAAVAQEPFGAVLGIGSGIRHRAGVHFGAGFDWRFFQRGGVDLAAGPELSAMALTYSAGPTWYVFGGLTITGRVRLW